jgi:hypothetical protein
VLERGACAGLGVENTVAKKGAWQSLPLISGGACRTMLNFAAHMVVS